MRKVALVLSAFLLSLACVAGVAPAALAHEEVVIGDIKIVGGWVNEPPLVNQLNGIVVEVSRNSTGEPITNAVAQVVATLKKGVPTKTLELQPTEEPGVYVADIIPTQTGQYEVVFRGTISGQAIDDAQIEIEAVDDTRILEFPTRQVVDPSVPTELIEQLEAVISDLNSQVDRATVASEEAVKSAQAATEAAGQLRESADRAYLFGMVGVGIGVAAIIISVVSMSRKDAKA
jgi:hypothetical protein